MKILGRCARSVAVSAAVVLLLPGGARAASVDQLTLSGILIVQPGIPALGTTSTNTHHTWLFDVVSAGTESGIYTGCTLEGDSTTPDSLVNSEGSGTLVQGPSCNISGTVNWMRTLTVVTFSGTVTISGVTTVIQMSALLAVPVGFPPFRTFEMTGVWVLAG